MNASSRTVLLIPIDPSAPPAELGELTMTFDAEAHTWKGWMDISSGDIGGRPWWVARSNTVTSGVGDMPRRYMGLQRSVPRHE